MQHLVKRQPVITFSPSALSSARHLPRKLLSKKLATARAGRGMLIAIDPGVQHSDVLAAGAVHGAELLMLDPRQDSILQITQALHHSATTNIHIVAHGSPGCLHFSSGDLTLNNLDCYAEQLESWFSYRPAHWGSKIKVQAGQGSFLSLHACNVAEGAAGSAFLECLQHLVGVSIHASQSTVGSVALSGSWQLEVSYPFPHEARLPFTQALQEAYVGTQ